MDLDVSNPAQVEHQSVLDADLGVGTRHLVVISGKRGAALRKCSSSRRCAISQLIFFKSQTVEYELRVQLCKDLERMPVEDASIEWSEDLSPYQPVANITLPAQDVYCPARRVYADDRLSFSPWHCIAEHRPLGSIMRVRAKAYETSTRFRHEVNMQPSIEPRDLTNFPN